MFRFVSLFLRRFSPFHTHLPIVYCVSVCVCSTSLLIIWLVGFDQSQCQSSVCLCVFFNEFFAVSVYFYVKNECAKNMYINCVWLRKNVCTCFKRILFCFLWMNIWHTQMIVYVAIALWISMKIRKEQFEIECWEWCRWRIPERIMAIKCCINALFSLREHFHIKHFIRMKPHRIIILKPFQSHWTLFKLKLQSKANEKKYLRVRFCIT